MTDFQLTPEQEAIVAEVRHGKDSLLIRAYAGCAKTTTLTLASKEIRIPGLALAFNKHIKEELARRFPPNFSVQTMNGLGHQAIIRALPRVTVRLDDKKLGRLLGEAIKYHKVELSADQWEEARQLLQSAMHNGLVPSRYATGLELLSDTLENWHELADMVYMEPESKALIIDIVHYTLCEWIEESYKGVITFDDQSYFSVCLTGKFPQFPLLMVDEAQDLSPLNHEMVRRSVRPDGRLIVCGDPKQAIYGFRGADYTSMDKLKALRGRWSELPLNTTFRCPKAVVQRQQEHAPGFRAAQGNIEGTFVRMPNGTREIATDHGDGSVWREPATEWTWQDVEDASPPGAQIAVLCRNNAPLLSLAFKLLRQRVPVAMLGRDIGQGLVRLAKSICPKMETSLEDFALLLEAWKIKEVSLAMANGKENKVDGITDRAECLEAVMSYPDVSTVGELCREVQQLFARDKGRITLSSIHKAKGLEWDVVMLLDPWRIPSKQSLLAVAKGDEGPLTQEKNLKYVAETRSKNVLLHASMGDFE